VVCGLCQNKEKDAIWWQWYVQILLWDLTRARKEKKVIKEKKRMLIRGGDSSEVLNKGSTLR
jgi:hypothetical protein